jgi:hypothetical protein
VDSTGQDYSVERMSARRTAVATTAVLAVALVVVGGLVVSATSPGKVRNVPRRLAGAISCSTAAHVPPSLLLSDTSPTPVARVSAGTEVVVQVPRWHGSRATPIDLHAVLDDPGVLRQQCSRLLAGGGRIVVLRAVTPGQVVVGASVTPATNDLMPSWGGFIVVAPRPGASTSALPGPRHDWQQLYCTGLRGDGKSRVFARMKMGTPSHSGSGPRIGGISPFGAALRIARGQSWDEWAIPVPDGRRLYVLAIYDGSTVASTHWYTRGSSDVTALCHAI